jgi:hypothetical protein
MHLGYRGRHRTGRSAASAVVAAAVAGAALVPAVLLTTATGAEAALCPSPPIKCYKVDLSPASFVAGSTQQITAKLKNESGGQSLGSSNLDAPAGYTITSLGTPSTGTATLSGNQVQFRNLNLPVGQTVTVALTVQSPDAAGSGTWASTAKQSNDYKGAGNDFVLDPASGRTTTTTSGSGGSGTAGCPSYDVSCGSNFIRYDRASSVSTGTAVNSNVWLVARIDFPATNVSGGQLYSIEAPLQPESFCPVDGSPAQCQFQVNIDTVPGPYDAAHPATLTILCDSSHCSSNTGAVLLVKRDENNNNTVILPCPLNLQGDPCYTTAVNGDGDTVITMSNITAGDPKIAGIMLG